MYHEPVRQPTSMPMEISCDLRFNLGTLRVADSHQVEVYGLTASEALVIRASSFIVAGAIKGGERQD